MCVCVQTISFNVRPCAFNLERIRSGSSPGIDDHGFACRFIAHDGAVALKHSDREGLDDHGLRLVAPKTLRVPVVAPGLLLIVDAGDQLFFAGNQLLPDDHLVRFEDLSVLILVGRFELDLFIRGTWRFRFSIR